MRNSIIIACVIMQIVFIQAQPAATKSSCFACAKASMFQCVGNDGGDNNPWAVACCNSK